MRGRRLRALGGLLLALSLATLVVTPAMASQLGGAMNARLMPGGPAQVRGRALQRGIAQAPSEVKPYWACPNGPCDAIIDPRPARTLKRSVRGARPWALPAGGPLLEGGGELGGYSPQDLQSAYDIPSSGGSTQTIALVDAYGYEAAEEDLAKYRERYGLGPCTKGDGCFRKVNEKGQEADYPASNTGWEGESALDLDMASAAHAACHILLVEAANDSLADLGAAVDEAATLGATEISNSYGIAEQICPNEGNCEELGGDYDHPGVVVTASAGDSGYDNYLEGGESPSFPATSPYVVAVGGTSLKRSGGARGWSEEVWLEPERGLGTGSGCSRSEPKPLWQVDMGCPTRTGNDVAAVAACNSPVSVYDSGNGGWADFCGTSASAPLVAGIEAHASEYARSLPGADAFYQDPGALFDVTAGSNEGLRGECVPPAEDEYLCHAQVGYDGPTGNGTPDGPLAIAGVAPTVATKAASAATGTTAALHGSIDSQGLETTYRFEYGTTSSYGTDAPIPDASAGSGTGTVAVDVTITGLQANTTYHYRLVASNAAGTSRGPDLSFTTALPTVTGIQPSTGPSDGGSDVTITGTGFAGVIAVEFGSSAAKSFVVGSETSISAVSPPGGGSVDVTVTTAAGTSAPGANDRFTYTLGPVLAWGSNYGRLGDGTATATDLPVEMLGVSQAVALAAGGDESLALLKDGTVMASGFNEIGEVGDGTYKRRFVPVHVCAVGVTECPHGPYLEEVVSVAAGAYHSLALLKNGTVMGWGDNYEGQVGAGTNATSSAVPTPVCVVSESPCKPENYLSEVTAIAAGGWHSLALLDNGTVVAWGYNQQGQLGDGTDTGPEACDDGFAPCSRTPVAVSGLTEVKAIAAGTEQSLALLKNGTIMAWGDNEYGDLGDGTTESRDVPGPVCATGEAAPCGKDLGEVAAIAGGWDYSLALLKNGTVKAWGENYEGELGDGGNAGPERCGQGASLSPCSRTPVGVLFEPVGEVVAIAAGQTGTESLALLKNGDVMAWGNESRLGDGTLDGPRDRPVHVCAPESTGPCPNGPYLHGEVTAMAVGGDHSLVSLRPAPTVTGVQPDEGPLSGGTMVTITGIDLAGATTVKFGEAEATEVEVESPDEITAISPPGAGTADVTVTTAEGTSTTSPADRFTYVGPPTAATGTASSITSTSATLNGTVNPNDENVSSCEIEYGTSPTLASPAKVSCGSPGSGSSPVHVSASATGLNPDTPYYFRVDATNASGAGQGSIGTFTTLEPPEYGRCVKVATGTGTYKTSACDSLKTGGSYEWDVGPVKTGFTLSGTTATLETRGRAKVACKAAGGSGIYRGQKEVAGAAIAFSGCEDAGAKCSSAGAAAGEIVSNPLEGTPQWESKAAKKVLQDLYPVGKTGLLLKFECGSTRFEVRGSVLASVKADEMAAADALKFKASRGEQKPAQYETPEGSKVTDRLEASIDGGRFEQTGLKATITETPEEPLEINAFV